MGRSRELGACDVGPESGGEEVYREETRKRIEKAIAQVLAREGALPGFMRREQQELAEDAALLARMLSDELWFEGYELALHVPRPTTPVS